MKVKIKSFDVDMDVKNSGVEFQVHSPDGKEFLGDLIIKKSGLVWCKGKTRAENGITLKWKDFIKMVENGD